MKRSRDHEAAVTVESRFSKIRRICGSWSSHLEEEIRRICSSWSCSSPRLKEEEEGGSDHHKKEIQIGSEHSRESRMKRSRDYEAAVTVESSSRFPKIRRICGSWSSSSPRLKEEGEEEDRISNLPDHILASILSLMITGAEEKEIDEVVRTSVLSRRWRCLWKYSLKSILTFTFKEYSRSVCDPLYMKFVDRVNHILAIPVYGDTIDEFNLKLWLDRNCDGYETDLLGWIDTVVQKRVKRLSIDLNYICFKRFTLSDNVIRNHNIGSLVSLCLVSVDVTGEQIEHLLAMCGSLEHLSITESDALVDLTVSGPSLKLRYLKIIACFHLQHLYIGNVVNLVSFELYNVRPRNTLVIENVPHLRNARVVKGRGAAKILGFMPQLQTLAFEVNNCCMGRVALKFPKLENLMQLELLLIGITDFSNAVCATLLVSCPFIRELIIEFELRCRATYAQNKKAKRLKHPHEYLEVVKIIGFTGNKVDIGVPLYIIENTSSLKTLLVHTSQLPDHEATRERARATAKERLGTRLSHTRTEFVLK